MSNSSNQSLTAKQWIGAAVASLHNSLLDVVRTPPVAPQAVPLREIHERASVRTDISDHLMPLFKEAITTYPKLIVELGVRGGESTYVLERVARLSGNAALVSVDIEDCSKVIDYKGWRFVKSDDIAFARRFKEWGGAEGLPTEIDFLFIDTSHVYEHTLEELRHWLPLVAPQGRVALHDTNQARVYRRRDGSIGIGWANRGTIEAVEKHFETRFPERQDFLEIAQGWLIDHRSTCNGMTFLSRLPVAGR